MEANRSGPPLTLQPFDPEVFQRVWDRVMPDQTHSPIEVERPAAVPAVSLPSPLEEPPRAGTACLGESSRGEVPALERWMEDTQELLYTLASLSRRTQGRASRTLGALAQQLRQEQRRLSAAHFLITGNRYSPIRRGESLSGPLDHSLRTLFQAFRRRAALARSAAGETEDLCLSQLFQDLGDLAERYSGWVRSLLEIL